VILIVLIAATLTGVYYWSTRHSIERFSQEYMQEVSERIGQAVHEHLRASATTLDVALPQGTIIDDDLTGQVDSMRSGLWAATGLGDAGNDYVYYGNDRGQSIALKRRAPEQAQLRL